MILDTSGIGPGHFRIWKRGVCPYSEAHEGGRRSAIWPPLGPEVVALREFFVGGAGGRGGGVGGRWFRFSVLQAHKPANSKVGCGSRAWIQDSRPALLLALPGILHVLLRARITTPVVSALKNYECYTQSSL